MKPMEWYELFRVAHEDGVSTLTAGPLVLIAALLLIIAVLIWRWARDGASAEMAVSQVKVKLPLGMGDMTFVPDRTQQEAAWELFVELQTRVATQPLDEGAGLLREALSSLYTVFDTTREILREAGPTVGMRPDSVGGLAMAVLNHDNGLRAFLTGWHPELGVYEATRPDGVSAKQHEDSWECADELRRELKGLRMELLVYAKALEEIAGAEVSESTDP